MWKNPTPITNSFSEMVKLIFDSYPPHSEYWTDDMGELEDSRLFVAEIYNRILDSYLNRPASSNDWRKIIEKIVLDSASRIESSKDWLMVCGLRRLSNYLSVSFLEILGRDPRILITYQIASAIHLLVGSEERYLIGARFNQPTWKRFNGPQWRNKLLGDIIPIQADIQFFDASDLDVLPDIDQLVIYLNELQEVPKIVRPMEVIADLIEDSYYHQQFLPHPSGSMVKVTGVRGIDSVVIKAKRSIYDKNFVDLIGIFSLTHGKAVSVLDSRLSTWALDHTNVNEGEGQDVDWFLRWLLAQLYHDLVTAKDVVPGRERRLGNKAKAAAKLPEKVAEDLKWIYIPRKRKKETLEIRRPAVNPRSMSPHRVSGHKRKANMTDRQREAVRALEQESGIEILRWIPEGYTFVRPHIVPADGSASIMQLPRFIRTRIQEDIKSLLLRSDE